MGQSATETVDQASSSRAPSPAIDRGQLARVTFGDRNLEHEVLTLFDRQSALLLERMRAGDGASIEALAHTMKGSAASIGADTVARAAEAAERAASGPAAGVSAAIDRLAEAVAQARALIAELLRAA